MIQILGPMAQKSKRYMVALVGMCLLGFLAFGVFILRCDDPVSFSQRGGVLAKGSQLELSSNRPNATVYYTVDGSSPRKNRDTQCSDARPRLWAGLPTLAQQVLITHVGRFCRTSASDFGGFNESRVFIAMSAQVETFGCVSDQEVRGALSPAAIETCQSLTPKLGRCFAETRTMERECDARVAAGVEELLHGCCPALRGGAKSLE